MTYRNMIQQTVVQPKRVHGKTAHFAGLVKICNSGLQYYVLF